MAQFTYKDIEEFLLDDDFFQWARYGSSDNGFNLESYKLQHPGCEEKIELAVAMVRSMKVVENSKPTSREYKMQSFNKMMSKLQQQPSQPVQSYRKTFPYRRIMTYVASVAAEEKGLGICYLGTTTYNPQMIIEALELPELVFPITTVTVGWPAETPAQVDRLPLEAIVHEETYHDYTPEDIDRLYAYKESLPENKRFIVENNKETLAQVFTDVRYTKKDSEAMSETLWKAMKAQGF